MPAVERRSWHLSMILCVSSVSEIEGKTRHEQVRQRKDIEAYRGETLPDV
jgi:hypothetical protein